MEYSVAHQGGMNKVGSRLWPDGRVSWDEAAPPDLESGDERKFTGRLRMCPYCGSMHPADVAAAIKAGARGSMADMKYGWPHKFYFDGVPNPHAGSMESRSAASYKAGDDWIRVRDNSWRDPGKPAQATVMWKFYAIHLLDATDEDRVIIEEHLGLRFKFGDKGSVSWEDVRSTE